MNSNSVINDQKVVAVITGASRGIGREIAVQLAETVKKESAFVVTARSEEDLEVLRKNLHQINDGLNVLTLVVDLSKEFHHVAPPFEAALLSLARNDFGSSRNFDSLLLFHNAGTIGDINCRAEQLNDEKNWHNYLQTNLVSTMLLNNLVLQVFDKKVVSQRCVINITSLLAEKAFPSFTQYSVGKAAREAFFRGLAIETVGIRVLSYSPGPVSTAMYDEICNKSYDSSVREVFKRRSRKDAGEGKLNRRILMPKETVATLLKLLNNDSYENGSRIDYFDVQ